MHNKLKQEGIKCNYKVVEDLMRKHEIRPTRRRRYKSTTDSRHNLPVNQNVLDRQFTVSKPNAVWVGDITYIETHEGWLYLAVWIDLYSRMVVGWAMSETMTADLVVNALKMAKKRRGCCAKLVHSDRGSQYASALFRQQLETTCIQSMSRKANCWDNAVAESFFGSLKSELIHHQSFKSRNQTQLSVFEYIEIFYNKRRLHSSLGYLSPEIFELKGKKVA